MDKDYIMKNYPRKISQRFAGGSEDVTLNFSDKNIAAGIANQMTIIVSNKNTVTPLPFALIPANFDTLSIKAATVDSQIVVTKAYNNVEEMRNSGFVIDGVACDGGLDIGAVSTKGQVSYACSSADPARSIKKFMDYIKLNPVRLKNVEVVSSDNNAFDTSMMLTFINPFFKNAEQQIDLSAFFSLYQYSPDRVRIDVDGKIELSDLSLLTAVIPENTTMKFILRFM